MAGGRPGPAPGCGEGSRPCQGSPAALRYRSGAKRCRQHRPLSLGSRHPTGRCSGSPRAGPRESLLYRPTEKNLTTQAPDRNSTALTAESLTRPGTAFKQPRAPLGPVTGPLSSRVRYPTASHRPGGDRTRKMGQQAQGKERKKEAGGEGNQTTKTWERKPLPLMRQGTRRVLAPGAVPHGAGVQCQPPHLAPRPTEPRHPETYLTLIRYWAKLMLAADPVMVTCLSVDPSTGLAILICAPDIWRISLILAP